MALLTPPQNKAALFYNPLGINLCTINGSLLAFFLLGDPLFSISLIKKWEHYLIHQYFMIKLDELFLFQTFEHCLEFAWQGLFTIQTTESVVELLVCSNVEYRTSCT